MKLLGGGWRESYLGRAPLAIRAGPEDLMPGPTATQPCPEG